MKALWALALCLPCLALAVAPLPPSATTTQTWTIDPAQSQARFSVRKFWFVHARGTFTRLHGTLHLIDTRRRGDLAEVNASIDVIDLKTDSPKHTARALAEDFFDAADYPRIRFDSEPFPLHELVTGGALRGTLLLHGQRHPVTFTLQPSTCPQQPLDCAIRVNGALSRRQFGMRAMPLVVGNKVHLSLEIRLRDCAACERP